MRRCIIKYICVTAPYRFNKKLSKYEIGDFILYENENIIINDKRGNILIYSTLNDQFGVVWQSFGGKGSVIEDIKDYMNEDERELYNQYRSQFGTNNSDD